MVDDANIFNEFSTSVNPSSDLYTWESFLVINILEAGINMKGLFLPDILVTVLVWHNISHTKYRLHYNDVTCLLNSLLKQTTKKNIKTLHHLPFVREFTDQWSPLTLEVTGSFFFQNKISFSNVVHYECHILVWNLSNIIAISSAQWVLMPWCFSTRASVATVLGKHTYVTMLSLHHVIAKLLKYIIYIIFEIPSVTMGTVSYSPSGALLTSGGDFLTLTMTLNFSWGNYQEMMQRYWIFHGIWPWASNL